MTPQEFEAQLKTEHYGEIAAVEKPAGYVMGEHLHAFDACALITAGAIVLQVDGVSTNYAVGDIFRLPAGTPHHESALAGVSYLVGRRQVNTA